MDDGVKVSIDQRDRFEPVLAILGSNRRQDDVICGLENPFPERHWQSVLEPVDGVLVGVEFDFHSLILCDSHSHSEIRSTAPTLSRSTSAAVNGKRCQLLVAKARVWSA